MSVPFCRAWVPALLFCFFLPALPSALSSAHAQSGVVTGVVSITATRTPLGVNDAVAEVTVIDRAALDRAQGRTLVEILATLPGLQFSSNGGLGKASSVFIRGLEARHTLLLVDGVRVGSATLGTPSFDNLPLEAIERIEVVRGPLSSVYGNGAMGGVVQVFTRAAVRGLTGNAKLEAGSNQFGQASAGLGFGNGLVDAVAQLQHTSTRGLSATNPAVPFGSYNADRDGFRQTGGSLRLGLQAASDWRVELLALQARGVTGLDDGPAAEARAGLDNRVLSLSARGKVTAGWQTRLALTESVDAYETLSSASAFASLGTIQTKQKQIQWENTASSALGTWLLLAERSQDVVTRPGQPFAVSQRDINGLAVGLNGSAAGHVWQASLRRDQNSQFGSANTGAVGWAYNVTPAWRVGASVGTSFVAPSFNQLYFPNFGNPLLRPEEGEHGEVQVRWAAGEHSVRAAYYEHRYRGFIPSGNLPVNLPRAEITGLTLSYEGQWNNLALAASLDHTDPRNSSVGTANFDKLLPRRAKDAARAAADWSAGAWQLGAAVQGFSARFDNASNTARLGGYATLDLRAAYAVGRDAVLSFKLNNLAGKVYETVLGYNQPGREAYLSLRYVLR